MIPISLTTGTCLAVVAATWLALRAIERRTSRNLARVYAEYETRIRRSREETEAAIRRTAEGRR